MQGLIVASVEFKHITKQFDNNAVALKDFNLQVEEGELLVLVGASGCGKSTALRLLAGLEMPTRGEVLIDNQVVNHATPQQRNIAMVFQNYALYPHMTVQENLAFPLKMAHTTRATIKTRVKEIADLLELSGLLERKPAQLSGGQRQRVAMGRALVRDPSVFLLDEPLSNLDAKLRAQIRADIARIQKNLKKTTIYVTHDQVEAMTLGDRVAVLAAGELQQVGTPEQLYNHPATMFVAQFIGSPGMNIVPCRLAPTDTEQFSLQLGGITTNYRAPDQVWKSRLIEYAEQLAFAGFRPEALTTIRSEAAIALSMKVTAVEYLGHESLIYLEFSDAQTDSQGSAMTARLPGGVSKRAGETLELFINPAALCFFDAAGRNILRQTPA